MRDQSERSGEDLASKAPEGAPPATVARRAYVSPRLTQLGKVAELTYGALGTPQEDAAHKN